MDFDYSCISDVVDALGADSAQQYLNLGWSFAKYCSTPIRRRFVHCIFSWMEWNARRS